MLKRILTVLLALTMMISVSVSVGLAAEKANGEPGQGDQTKTWRHPYPKEYAIAAEAAKAEVPTDALFQGIIDGQDTVTFSFYDNNTLRSYEAVVLKSVNKVKEVKIGGSSLPGSTTITKTPQDIKAIVLQEYPDAKNLKVGLTKEGHLSYYEAVFETEKYIKADIKINPVTGAFGNGTLQYKVDMQQVKDIPPVKDQTQAKEEQPAVRQNQIPPVPAEWTCVRCGTVIMKGSSARTVERNVRQKKLLLYAANAAGSRKIPTTCPISVRNAVIVLISNVLKYAALTKSIRISATAK